MPLYTTNPDKIEPGNKYTQLRKMFAQSKQQDNKFNKKLYDSDIIQVLYERIAELEDRLNELVEGSEKSK